MGEWLICSNSPSKYFNLIMIARDSSWALLFYGIGASFRAGDRKIYEMLGITVITANCLNILPFIVPEISAK